MICPKCESPMNRWRCHDFKTSIVEEGVECPFCEALPDIFRALESCYPGDRETVVVEAWDGGSYRIAAVSETVIEVTK